MILVIVLVSSIVILNPIDYLSLMESYLFLIYPSLLQFSMIRRVFPNDLIITFVYWDWLGLLSYLPTNFRSSKTNCGIKAVVYNKIGDSLFLLLLALSYSFLPRINYYPFLPLSFIFNFFFIILIELNWPLYLWISLSLPFIFFTKSAQLPFSSRSINATSAPTPVPSPLPLISIPEQLLLD